MDPWWDQHRPLRRPSVGGIVVDGDPHPRGASARTTEAIHPCLGMASALGAHALLCQRREKLLGQVLQSLGAPEAVRLRVLTWERRNRLRIRCQFLIVEVLYRRILLHHKHK